MGNVSSSDMPRKAPHKLSKPRTNNPSSAPSPLISPRTAASPRFSNPSLLGSPSHPPSSLQSPVAAAPWPLVPGDGMTERLETLVEGLPGNDHEHTNGVYRTRTLQSEHLSRRNSLGVGMTTSKSLGGNPSAVPRAGDVPRLDRAMSLQTQDVRTAFKLDLHPYESQRLNMRREGCDTMPSTRRESFDAAAGKMDSQQSAGTYITRNASDVSLYTPMRRRSIIQTPGVATRAHVPLSTKSSFRRSHPATPTMSRRNSVEPGTTRHISLLPPPLPAEAISMERSITPSEEEFKQLGAMKFGSLRIVNGSPVTTPTPEHGHRGPGPFSPPPEDSTSGHFGNSKASPATANCVPGMKVSKAEGKRTHTSTSYGTEEGNSTTQKPEETNTTLSPRSFEKFVAMAFNQESNPFVPDFLVTTKHTEHDDHLFEEEASPLEYTAPEILEVRDDPHAKPVPGSINPASQNLSGLSRSDSAYVESPSSEVSRMPLTKSDSGYASKASLRSPHGSGSKPRQEEMNAQSCNDTLADTSANPGQNKDIEGQSHACPCFSPDPQADKATVASSKSLLSPSSLLHLPSLRSSRSYASTEKSNSDAGPVRTGSVESRASQASRETPDGSKSINDNAGKPSKLQRLLSVGRRKSLPAAYSVFAKHEIDTPVPSIPTAMEDHLDQRNGQFPTATRRLALRIEPSKETLQTIFSVGSMDVNHLEDQGSASQREQALEQPESSRRSLRRRSLHSLQSLYSLRKAQSHASIFDATSVQSRVDISDMRDSDLGRAASQLPIDKENMSNEANVGKTARTGTDTGSKGRNEAVERRVQATEDQLPQARRTLKKPNRDGKVGQGLTTRASEPDFLSIDPMPHGSQFPGMLSSRRAKTPPPLSMRSNDPRKPALVINGREINVTDYSSTDKMGGSYTTDKDRMGSITSDARSQRLGPSSSGYESISQPGSGSLEHYNDLSMREKDHGHRRRIEPYQRLPFREQTQHGAEGRKRSNLDGYKLTQSQPLYAAPDMTQGQPVGSYNNNYTHQLHDRASTSRPYQRHTRGGSLDSATSQVENPPFRVLHSYNSPAYRGVPIWG